MALVADKAIGNRQHRLQSRVRILKSAQVNAFFGTTIGIAEDKIVTMNFWMTSNDCDTEKLFALFADKVPVARARIADLHAVGV